VSDVEFGLPKPSYTIDTLAYLKEKYPDRQFALLMGGDNLPTIPKWKNYELLLRDYELYVYARPDYDLGPLATHPSVRIFSDVPMMQISASYIRDCLINGQSIQYLVPETVYTYLMGSSMYRK
jgi:nicotinate-nucleotide adenylyltransferase